MRLIVGVTGASGVVMSYHILGALKSIPDCETHLVMTACAKKTWELETTIHLAELEALADVLHDDDNLAASVSSGSFQTDGMIIIPCSMKTLAGIANGYTANLLGRAADVCLKENRKVVIVPREMPLGKIHIRNLSTLSDLGCVIIPPVLTFYNNPENLTDQINHITGKILMQFGLSFANFQPWEGV
jgi:4-hydroxy-3-polyprenylbenzoate decarboxylase